MTQRRPRAAAALVAAALLMATALTAADAQGASSVKIAEAPTSHFPDMAFNLSLPKNQPLTAGQVQVSENGSAVPDVTVTKPGAENVGTVLAIDASQSMAGKPIAGALAAARAFAARRNPGQQLGVVTFNDNVVVVLPLTNDAASIEKALAKPPPLSSGTHIYEGLQKAATLLQDAGIQNGSIVLLSDGRDVGSTVDQATAVKAVGDAKARVFAVGLRSPQYDSAALAAIAAKSSGTYSEAASADKLSQIYDALGYTISHEYLLKYRSLAGPGVKRVVAVRVAGIPGAARASYTTPALALAPPSAGPSFSDRVIRSSVTLIVVILIVVALLGYAVFRIVYRPDQALTRRIGQFVTLPSDEEAEQRQAEVSAILADDRRPADSRRQRLEDELEIAGITMPLRTIVILTAVGGLLFGILVAILVGSPVGLLALLVAPFVTRSIINLRLRRTRQTFADQLPENLDVLSSGLRSGHSFTGAMAVCVDDAAEPAKSEFKRAIADEQLGVPIDEALHVIGRRMQNRDIVQVALVAKLQREAGTNAADVLDQVAVNIRNRLELRRLIAALTAQGRMARWIVSLLPVLLFVAIFFLNKGYLKPLWTEPAGIVGLIAAAIMIVTGSLIIKRIVNIEV